MRTHNDGGDDDDENFAGWTKRRHAALQPWEEERLPTHRQPHEHDEEGKGGKGRGSGASSYTSSTTYSPIRHPGGDVNMKI